MDNMEEKGKPLGDVSPSLTFIFTMLTVVIWGNYAGIYTGPTALAIGCVQLASYIPYLVGAVLLFVNRESLTGNIFFIFSVLFGGVGAFLNLATGISEICGYEMTTQMAAIPFFWGAIAMIPFVFAIRKDTSAVSFLCFSAVILFLTLMMFAAFSIGPVEVLNTIIMWLMIFVAVSGCYTMFNALLVQGGCKPLPEGKPLFKRGG